MDKFKDHPFSSDYNVITAAFDKLIEVNTQNFTVLRNYRGALSQVEIEQLDYELDRIKAVRAKVLVTLYLPENLKK